MKKYIIFDLDWTLLKSEKKLTKIIFEYLNKKYDFTEDEYFYFFSRSQWTWLDIQLQQFLNISEEKSKKEANEIYNLIDKNSQNIKFFDSIPEKILELSKNYKLFLSTWSSTKFAEEILKKWWIYDYFEYILWSENISKSSEHIKIFKEISLDPEFEKFAIFVWDWTKDREIAKENSIDFIHIDEKLENRFSDKYEIKSVAFLSNILNSNF